MLDCTAPSKLVSAVVYAEEIKMINFQLKDNSGSVLDDTTITVQQGEQRLNFDFDIPIGSGLQLGVSDTGNTRLFRNRENIGSVMSYPYVGSTVTITGSTANQPFRNYYFYYDIEIKELSSNLIAGCKVFSDTLTITEPDSILISEVSHIDVTCNGGNDGEIDISVSGGVSSYSYLWSNGSISQDISSLVSGSYTCTVTDGNNCTQTASFNISEPSSLSASIVQSPQNTYVLIANMPIGGVSPYSYSWREQSSPNTALSSGTGTTYNVYSPGTYFVKVTDAHGCEVISNSFTYTSPPPPLDIEDLSASIALSVYPNPFNRETTVDFGQVVRKATIRIVDVYGKFVEKYELLDVDKYIIKRTNKSSGVYFMEIEIDNEELITKKLIIE